MESRWKFDCLRCDTAWGLAGKVASLYRDARGAGSALGNPAATHQTRQFRSEVVTRRALDCVLRRWTTARDFARWLWRTRPRRIGAWSAGAGLSRLVH